MDRHIDLDGIAAFASAGQRLWIVLAAVVLTELGLLAGRLARRRESVKDMARGELQRPGIEPLCTFNWQDAEPRKLRPFRPVYHITMALQPDTASDLIVIDKNYLDRVNLRRELIAQHGRTVHGCLTSGRDAVREVYSFLLGEYLPCRYPTMFELSADDKTFHNLVTGREHPTVPASDDMASALRVIGETVEDDMFILHHTPEGHFTDAFVCCFPAGFDGSEKLGKLLGDVHAPVPSYDKIGPSMERFFRKLEVGKSVKRTNWSIQTSGVLFNCKAHATPTDNGSVEEEAFSIDSTYARIELQTLTRLPRTRSILFSFKTYLYPLREIKAEGLGADLATAIEGLDAGNAPGMQAYKGSSLWAERVCKYLRSCE